MKTSVLRYAVVFIFTTSCVSMAKERDHRPHLRSIKSHAQNLDSSRNTRHKNRSKERHRDRSPPGVRRKVDDLKIETELADYMDIHGSPARFHGNPAADQGNPLYTQENAEFIQGNPGIHGSNAANHDPIYGSEPPITAIKDRQFQRRSGSKSHLINDPHELLYSDQSEDEFKFLNDLDDSSRSNDGLDHSRAVPQNSAERLLSQRSKEALSSENLATDLPWDGLLDLETTTEGQAEQLNSAENSIDFENQGNWDDPDFLKDLVMDLQEQLKESKTSQRVTRSVLNTLEEKQNAQAIDLQTLKDEVLTIKKDQRQQKEVLAVIQEQVSNNAWGVRDVKDAHDQTKQDLGALKELQLAHNDTMIMLSDLSDTNTLEHMEHSNAIRYLQHELLGLRTQLAEDRSIIYDLQEELLEHEHNENSPDQQGSKNREVHNSIPVVPSLTDDLSRENSGDGSRSQEFHSFDELASSIEERHNVIGDHLSRIIAWEERMNEDITQIRSRLSFYDTKMAQLGSMYLNSSLQLAQIEKTLLANQNQHTQNGVTSLQEMASQLMNFTSQLVSLQNWHMSTKSSVNTTWNNQQQLLELENALHNHSLRIQGLERRTLDHRTNADDTLYHLEEKVEELETTLLQHHAKVSDLQIRILNSSLEKCDRMSKSLKQELQIQELDRGLTKVENRLDMTNDKITKIERGMSKLFEMSDKQGNALSRIVDTVHDVGKLLPTVTDLRKDMLNFLTELPADCHELLLDNKDAQSGVHLMHVHGSTTSVRLPCDFQDGSAWTVVQKRTNGNVSFDRTWSEYKYGFGDPETEFWIGNENLYFLTSQDNYQLQIDMIDIDGAHWWARYDVFHVSDEESMYVLHVDGYQGNATDAFRYSNAMPFSSIDVDNDVSSTNCAKFYTAGWWYKHCHYANLNGRYTVGIVWFNHDHDEWMQMKQTVMKIRPLKTQQHEILDNHIVHDN